jgi:hypothetical protein
VLRLKPGNVKALYRRAQARTELGKLSEAQEGTKAAAYRKFFLSASARRGNDRIPDLQLALKHEPNNESVKTELRKVSELLVKSKTKAPKQLKPASSKVSRLSQAVEPRLDDSYIYHFSLLRLSQLTRPFLARDGGYRLRPSRTNFLLMNHPFNRQRRMNL